MARSLSKSKLSKLDQAVSDLVESFIELESEMERAHDDDEDAYNHGMVEALETSLENAMEEHDVNATFVATALTYLSESLEQIDPHAFDDGNEEEEEDEEEDDDSKDKDYEDIDLDEDDDYEEDEESDEDDDD